MMKCVREREREKKNEYILNRDNKEERKDEIVKWR